MDDSNGRNEWRNLMNESNERIECTNRIDECTNPPKNSIGIVMKGKSTIKSWIKNLIFFRTIVI